MRKSHKFLIGAIGGVAVVGATFYYLKSEMTLDCYDAGGRGDFEEQIQACTDFIDTASIVGLDAAKLYSNRGRAYAELGQFRDALRDYNSAIAEDPSYVPAYQNRASTYYRLGDFARADHDLAMAIGLRPGMAGLHYARGYVRLAAENYDGAGQDFSAALAIDPTMTEALLMRAVAHVRADDLDQAAADLEQVLARDETEVRAHVQLGAIRMRQHDPQRALAQFRRAAEISPERGEYQAGIGHAAMALHDYAVAEAAFTRAIELLPGSADYLVERSLARVAAGLLDAAETDIQAALAIESDHLVALRALASLAEADGRHAVTLDAMNRLVAAEPNDSAAHLSIARAYAAQREWRPAIRHADLAEILDPALGGEAGQVRDTARAALEDGDG